MVESCDGPCELHLKKELAALRKGRHLRDPATCSSLRTPSSCRSTASTNNIHHRNGPERNPARISNSGGSIEIGSKSEKKSKKVYLYNWGQHSSTSSDNAINLDEINREESTHGSSEHSLSNSSRLDSKIETYICDPLASNSVRGIILGTPRRRAARKRRIRTKERKGALGINNSIEQLDNRVPENLWQPKNDLNGQTDYPSCNASPVFCEHGYGNRSRASGTLKGNRKDELSHSHTPSSNSSYSRWDGLHPSGTSASLDGDEMGRLDSGRHQGCGIPCCCSKKMSGRGCVSWYSPFLHDTPRTKGDTVQCGSSRLNRRRASSSSTQKHLAKYSMISPLLHYHCDVGIPPTDEVNDELSSNYGELELEAQSRLDGKRWPSCGSQGVPSGLLRKAPSASDMIESRNLSLKYRPRSFNDIVGQRIVVQSLSSGILKGRIAPAYIFQGPHGTGKTSIARIFAAALSCLSAEDNRPCGLCRECSDIFASANGSSMQEVDASNKKGMNRVKHLLEDMSAAASTRYKVFVIDGCHMLSSKTLPALVKILDEPPPHVVFIFTTTDPDNLPHAIVSRCHKYPFSKIKEADIISRLRKLSAEENLDVESNSLDLIASKSDGSLWEAETMLDQLSLLGQRITASLVNDLVGVASDEKLLDLLGIAMSSDISETVKRSRELMDSGADPETLMSQLAGLIADVIAGKRHLGNGQQSCTVSVRQSLTAAELERLHQALNILSDAKKQLKFSSERSTWFTAAFLRLGSCHNSQPSLLYSSRKQETETSEEGAFHKARGTSSPEKKSDHSQALSSANSRIKNDHSDPQVSPAFSISAVEKVTDDLLSSVPVDGTSPGDSGRRIVRCIDSVKLHKIWIRCINRCHPEMLRQLLSTHGKLVSITETEGSLIAYIAFGDEDVKFRAESFLSSIRSSVESVLRQTVEVRIGLVPEHCLKALESVSYSPSSQHTEEIIEILEKVGKFKSNVINVSDEKTQPTGLRDLPRRSTNYSVETIPKSLDTRDSSPLQGKDSREASLPMYPSKQNSRACGRKEWERISAERVHTIAAEEQRLDLAWVQAAEKSASGQLHHSKPQKKCIQTDYAIHRQNQNDFLIPASDHGIDALSNEIELDTNDSRGHFVKQAGKGTDRHRFAISPSLLHSNSFSANMDKESMSYSYESGSGYSGFCCWKTRKPYKGKVKQGNQMRSQKDSGLGSFRKCCTV